MIASPSTIIWGLVSALSLPNPTPNFCQARRSACQIEYDLCQSTIIFTLRAFLRILYSLTIEFTLLRCIFCKDTWPGLELFYQISPKVSFINNNASVLVVYTCNAKSLV